MKTEHARRKRKGQAPIIMAIFLVIILGILLSSLNVPVIKVKEVEKDVETKSEIHIMGNALDAAGLYMETALDYSVYQACYDNLKNGGWSEIPAGNRYAKDGRTYALWDPVGWHPDESEFLGNMDLSIEKNLALYTKSEYRFLSDYRVRLPPSYDVFFLENEEEPGKFSITAFGEGNLNTSKCMEVGECVRLEKDSTLYGDYEMDCYGIFLKGQEFYYGTLDVIDGFFIGIDDEDAGRYFSSPDLLKADIEREIRGMNGVEADSWILEDTNTGETYQIYFEILSMQLTQKSVSADSTVFNADMKIKFEIANERKQVPVYDGGSVSLRPLSIALVIGEKKDFPAVPKAYFRTEPKAAGLASYKAASYSLAEGEEECYDEESCGYEAECSLVSYDEEGSRMEESDCPIEDPCCQETAALLREDNWTVEETCCSGLQPTSGEGSVSFSGQALSLKIAKNKRYVIPGMPPEGTGELQKIAAQYATAYGVPRELVFAVIQKESSWNTGAASNKNAKGLMQLVPITIKDLAENHGMAECLVSHRNTNMNLKCGTFYLAKMLEEFKEEKLALAAFNKGKTYINKLIEGKGKCSKNPTYSCVKKFLPAETLRYVPKVQSYKKYYAGKIASLGIPITSG